MDRPLYLLRTVIFSILCFVSIGATAQYCCNANFTYSNTGGSSYMFFPDDSSNNSPTSWTWDFGNGSFSTEQFPTTQYSAPGNYQVTLTKQSILFDSQDSIVSTCSISKFIWVDSVSNPCNAEFDFSVSGQTAFFYSEDNTALLESWTFGDGGTSYDQNPAHTYSYPGTYTVCRQIYKDSFLLTAQDTSSQISCQVCKTVVVTDSVQNDSCNASFSYAISGNSVSFYGPHADFNYWSFGDGNYSYDQNPTHMYAAPGIYWISRHVIQYDSLQNFVDSCFSQNYIYVGPVDTCDAGFSSSNDGLAITFYPNSYSDYTFWTFGDGNYSYDQNPTHTYAAAGSYLVSRYVFSYDSLQNITDSCFSEHYIHVIASPDSCGAYFNVYTSGYTASFYGTYNHFNYWSFGDGNFSYDQYPTHTYAGPGTYLVSRFTANYDSMQNITDSCYSEHYVYIAPIDTCDASFTSSINGSTAYFYGTPSNGSNYWNFGDGNFSYDQSPIHNYAAPGTYFVTRTVITYDSSQSFADSCYSFGYVYILPDTCDASFTSSTNGSTAYFYATPSNGSNYWNFGDGNFSYDPSPIHNYAAPGTYFVTRTVITYDSSQSFIDSCSSFGYVYIRPDTCDASFTSSVSGFTASFQGTGSEGYNYWIFGDGNYSYDANPVHNYSAPGSYFVARYVITYDSSQSIVDSCSSFGYVYIAPLQDTCNAGFGFETNGNKASFTSYNEEGYGVWSFGDGQFSTVKNPTHKYQTSGNYLVTRTVLTYDSLQHILDTCQSSMYVYIAPVVDTCTAGFTYTFSSDTIHVEANETKGQHIWSFGDGSKSKQKGARALHVYKGNGIYTVCHTRITKTDSCTECQDVVLEKPIVLPNPAHDILTIQCNSGNLDHYYMYDINGNEVASQYNIQQSQVAINTSTIPAGQYYLQVRYANGIYSNYKILIQH